MYVWALKNLKNVETYSCPLLKCLLFAIIVLNNLLWIDFLFFREVFTKLAMDKDSGTSHTLQEKQETKFFCDSKL